MKKCLLLFLIVSLILFIPSCNKDNLIIDGDFTEKVTTIEIKPDEVTKFTSEPLKILYIRISKGAMDFGVPANSADNMFLNFMTLSDLCNEKLGFPLEFVAIQDPVGETNAYLSYLSSGLSADLIFPSKVNGISSYESTFYWNDKWIEDGLYMNLAEYIPQFCPQAIVNFERYPNIKQMCSRNGKVYAVYAGMPTVSALSLIIKDSILEENNLDHVTDFDTLLEIMNNKHSLTESIPEEQKILVNQRDLLFYSMLQKGYHMPWQTSGLGIVTDFQDEYFTPLFIEDTKVFDYMYDTFSPFFEKGYFTDHTDQYGALYEGKQDLYLTYSPLNDIKSFSRMSTDEKDNFFNKGYSIFMMDSPHIYLKPFDVLPIPVPHSSTQPEKALHAMQWLMTDQDAADILTYGSNIMKMGHYRFSSDRTIIPEENNTIYGFYNLIANFSDQAFLCGNKQFNIIEEYKKRTEQAIYPPIFRAMNSNHMNYEAGISFSKAVQNQFNDRRSFLNQSLKEWMEDPYSTLTAHEFKKDYRNFLTMKSSWSKQRNISKKSGDKKE